MVVLEEPFLLVEGMLGEHRVIAALEDHFGIAVDDGDISARRFATVGSLTEFVQEMLEP